MFKQVFLWLSVREKKLVMSLWNDIIKHLNIIYRSSEVNLNLIVQDVKYILDNIINIRVFLKFYSPELLFSSSKNNYSIINKILLNWFRLNNDLLYKYNYYYKYKESYLYLNSLYNFLLFNENEYNYFVSFDLYAFNDFISWNNYFWIADSSWLLSINIIKTKKSSIDLWNKILKVIEGKRLYVNEEIVFTWSFMILTDSIFITCLQNIKWYKNEISKFRFYRYVYYLIIKLSELMNVHKLYWFSNNSHPCSYENWFRWDYDNIFRKRWFKKVKKYFINNEFINYSDEQINYKDVINSNIKNFYLKFLA